MYTHYCKIHFITTKQSLRTISVSHEKQLSHHTNSIKNLNRGRQASIHMPIAEHALNV